MPVTVTLDIVLAKRRMKGKVLAEKVGISEQNMSLLRTGKVKGVRFSTLEKICEILDCQPGEILVYEKESVDDVQ